MLRIVLAAIAVVALPVAAQNAAPFCLVNQFGGANCFYYSLDACRMAQGTMGGICSANPAAMQQQQAQPQYRPPTPQPYIVPPSKSVGESFAEGYERGARMRRERELHQARLRALQAQTEAAERQNRDPEQAPASGNVIYKCKAEDGTPVYTTTPVVGCEVSGSL